MCFFRLAGRSLEKLFLSEFPYENGAAVVSFPSGDVFFRSHTYITILEAWKPAPTCPEKSDITMDNREFTPCGGSCRREKCSYQLILSDGYVLNFAPANGHGVEGARRLPAVDLQDVLAAGKKALAAGTEAYTPAEGYY